MTPHRKRLTLAITAALAMAAVAALGVRAGLVPPGWIALPAPDLAVGDAWFLDWRLAALKSDKSLCRTVLRQPQILSEPIADVTEDRGCGVANGVRLTTAGGARLALGRVTCETAAALALWMEHEVQPNAVRLLGTRVASVTHVGSYACRNIKGSPWLGAIRSEHATANAVDVTGFVLADGRTVSILRDWPRDGAEARFLHAAHRGACRYFRGVLGPRYNDLHKDHFHLDRGAISHCR